MSDDPLIVGHLELSEAALREWRLPANFKIIAVEDRAKMALLERCWICSRRRLRGCAANGRARAAWSAVTGQPEPTVKIAAWLRCSRGAIDYEYRCRAPE